MVHPARVELASRSSEPRILSIELRVLYFKISAKMCFVHLSNIAYGNWNKDTELPAYHPGRRVKSIIVSSGPVYTHWLIFNFEDYITISSGNIYLWGQIGIPVPLPSIWIGPRSPQDTFLLYHLPALF